VGYESWRASGAQRVNASCGSCGPQPRLRPAGFARVAGRVFRSMTVCFPAPDHPAQTPQAGEQRVPTASRGRPLTGARAWLRSHRWLPARWLGQTGRYLKFLFCLARSASLQPGTRKARVPRPPALRASPFESFASLCPLSLGLVRHSLTYEARLIKWCINGCTQCPNIAV
jgi:hypothetical protein